MRDFRRTANWVFIAVLCCVLCYNTAYADYRFDDLDTNSGIGAQWMVVTGASTSGGNTVGNPTSEGMDVSGDLASGRNPVHVLNGSEETDRTEDYEENGYPKVQTMFLVLSGAESSATDFTVNFGAPNETETEFGYGTDTVYKTNKAASKPSGKDYYDNGYMWSQNKFSIVKSSRQNTYESIRTNFLFHENPDNTSSQTLDVPMVISNVRQGSTASDTQLIFRTLLRDNQGTGDIAAYDRFTWNVQPGAAPVQNSQWVFVPVDSLPVDDNAKINYRLVSEIANHTSRRYAVQRYDSYSVYTPIDPTYWNFDLPYTVDNDDVARKFKLHKLSHIAPGLSTVYTQSYNVRQADKIPYRLYQVDPMGEYYNLSLIHKVIFGQNLGTAIVSGSGKYNPFAVTAFYMTPANPDFLKTVAATMNSTGISVPDTKNFISNSAISYEEVTADAVRSYIIKRDIPSALRSNSNDAMLPLHITFNIPRAVLQVQGKDYWDTMLEEWYNTGDIHDMFAQYFSVYMLSREEGSADNHWNLIQQLKDFNVYNNLMKVFMDEDRGVITVSFIVMLMDGTRDSLRPAIYLVKDETVSTSNSYIVLRDGHNDNVWNMTFYVAPASFIENNSSGGSGSTTVTFPTEDPVTSNLGGINSNTGGKCEISITQTTKPASGTLFDIRLSQNSTNPFQISSVNTAAASTPYYTTINNNNGILILDPDKLYLNQAMTSKATISKGNYYVAYQYKIDNATYNGTLPRTVELYTTSSSGGSGSKSTSSGGGSGGGCGVYSAGILLIAALVPCALIKKRAK